MTKETLEGQAARLERERHALEDEVRTLKAADPALAEKQRLENAKLGLENQKLAFENHKLQQERRYQPGVIGGFIGVAPGCSVALAVASSGVALLLTIGQQVSTMATRDRLETDRAIRSSIDRSINNKLDVAARVVAIWEVANSWPPGDNRNDKLVANALGALLSSDVDDEIHLAAAKVVQVGLDAAKGTNAEEGRRRVLFGSASALLDVGAITRFHYHFMHAPEDAPEAEDSVRWYRRIRKLRATKEAIKHSKRHLAQANLSGVDFECLDLAGANFRGAYLQGARFQGANLQGADFTDAVFYGGADFGGANVRDLVGQPKFEYDRPLLTRLTKTDAAWSASGCTESWVANAPKVDLKK